MNSLRWAALQYKNLTLRYQNLYLVGVAVIIGIAAALGNIAFRTSIQVIQIFFYDTGEEVVLHALQNTPVYKILLIPAFGGLIVGLIQHFHKSEGHGVSMVIKAIITKKRISPLVAFFTTLTSSITLGSAGSAGREGPIVQIGAALGSWIATLFRFPAGKIRFAIASGAGGGIAATFNTPLAGAMFTAEALLGRFDFKVFAPVVISCVTATVVSRAYFGNHVTFIAPEYLFANWYELFLYALLGLFVGVFGAAFLKVFFFTTKLFKAIRIPTFIKPAIGGLIVGGIGVFCRNIMGVGYGTIMEILNLQLTGYFLILLLGLKIAATSLTLGSGGSGGLFVPSLFVGAALGGFGGFLFSLIFVNAGINSASYALVGMGAMLAATMRIPITSILMIFEITQSYQVVLPIMATTIIAHVASSWLEKDSFISRPLAEEGMNIEYENDLAILENTAVHDMMLKEAMTFREDTPLLKMVEDIRRHPHQFFPVLNEKGILISSITLKDLREALFDPNIDNKKLTAKDFCRQASLFISPDSSLAEALAVFGMNEAGDLPVASKTADGPLYVGLLRRSDILRAYKPHNHVNNR
ncbi:MAG: chloride channel protein [Deferribacteraceae bacterium]|nr:chloride channel protein [Deferribacteraceae bacterium]